MDDAQPSFGTPPTGVTCQERPGAYAVALVGGRLLVVETPTGLYLPGGGTGPGEAPEETLRREVMEETGCRVARLARFASARQFLSDRTGQRCIVKIESFYAVELAGDPAGGEPDHRPRWLPVEEATAGLVEAAQAWAVRTAQDASDR
jgi:8-oxo-dGTP pyrophosphatase MutT (NUDIX family)